MPRGEPAPPAVGRGRLLAALSAVVLIVSCVPAMVDRRLRLRGPAADLRERVRGPSIAVFLVALATLALITLPYASDRPVSFDRWWAYATFAIVGWVGVGLRVVDLALTPRGPGTMTPDRGARPVVGRDRPQRAVARRLPDLARARIPLDAGRSPVSGDPEVGVADHPRSRAGSRRCRSARSGRSP